MKPKLLFYCQHVLGMGHFIRSAEIARGLTDFDVHFINGGEIVPGFDLPGSIEVINLPPIKSDADFRELQTSAGASLKEVKETRRRLILDEYERWRPDVLLIELFPFGRRKFAFELIPLLDRVNAAGEQTAVVCSLRDILVAKRDQEKFEAETRRLVNRYFDLLLVHADPRLLRLDETFTRVADLRCQVLYTGFVTSENLPERTGAPSAPDGLPTPNDLPVIESGEKLLLVSLGGGRVGGELVDGALAASDLLAARLPHHLLVFAGPYFPEAEFQRLMERVSGNSRVHLRRYTTRFTDYLRAADLSISMAGYNTCLNLVAVGARAIVYPFTGNDDREQTLRAEKLQALGLVDLIRPGELTPTSLAGKIIQAFERPRPSANAPALDLRGVEKTSAALLDLVTQRRQLLSAEAEAWASLDRTLAKIAGAGRKVEIFFRDDDIDEDEETLQTLLDLFLRYEVPLSLAVIPGSLTPAGIALLNVRCAAHPELIELNQHGWGHINHELTGRKCEFGPSRSFAEQYDDIARGQRLLTEAFGQNFSPVFVPPWNRLTPPTREVLIRLGFHALSGLRDRAPVVDDGLREIPVTLDLFRWKDGAELKTAAEFIGELCVQLEASELIGIMLHHKVMGDEAWQLVEHLLGALRRGPGVSFHTFRSLLEGRR
jgi:predicted glycosyltransferase